MGKNPDLLEGPVFTSIAKLAFPIMLTSFVQMSYNLMDMLWIGKLGSEAVAAVGVAGMYMLLGNGLVAVIKMGGQVKIGQALGAKREDAAAGFIKTVIQVGIVLGIVYGLASVVFAEALIGFFQLGSEQAISDAKQYLMITSGAVLFSFLNQIFTGIMTAMGNSNIAFKATAIGLGINFIVDPILILGWRKCPPMGVKGAAIATVFAQVVVTLVFLSNIVGKKQSFPKAGMHTRFCKENLYGIIRMGAPIGIQSILVTLITMISARLIANFGDSAVAVQKIGSQIESISWMAADGMGMAIHAFMAQNKGAGNVPRMIKGYKTVSAMSAGWGILCTLLLMGFAAPLFRIFTQQEETAFMGAEYLCILGISQLFVCLEVTTTGAFIGLGRTKLPSLASVLINSLRIPMAYALMSTPLRLNGIWWSFTISGILKGSILTGCFIFLLRKRK